MLINELTFAGNAGKDALDKTTSSGTRIVTFTLCHTQKAKQGGADKSTWITVKAFSWSAESAAKIKKGMNVFVRGPLSIDEYTAKDGSKKTSVCLIANSIGILEKGSPRAYEQASEQVVETPSIGFLYNPDDLSDIPF